MRGGDLILINFNVYSSFSVAKLRTDNRTYVRVCMSVGDCVLGEWIWGEVFMEFLWICE
jgi:hypothetical protein